MTRHSRSWGRHTFRQTCILENWRTYIDHGKYFARVLESWVLRKKYFHSNGNKKYNIPEKLNRRLQNDFPAGGGLTSAGLKRALCVLMGGPSRGWSGNASMGNRQGCSRSCTTHNPWPRLALPITPSNRVLGGRSISSSSGITLRCPMLLARLVVNVMWNSVLTKKLVICQRIYSGCAGGEWTPGHNTANIITFMNAQWYATIDQRDSGTGALFETMHQQPQIIRERL